MVVVVALARTVQLQKPQCFGGIDILFCGVFGKNVSGPLVQLAAQPDADRDG